MQIGADGTVQYVQQGGILDHTQVQTHGEGGVCGILEHTQVQTHGRGGCGRHTEAHSGTDPWARGLWAAHWSTLLGVGDLSVRDMVGVEDMLEDIRVHRSMWTG